MISHTPNSLLEKRLKKLNEVLELRNELIASMRQEIMELKKKQNTPLRMSADQKKIDSLSETLRSQNALIANLTREKAEQQDKILRNKKINSLLENKQKLEAKLLAANETIRLLKTEKTNSNVKDYISDKKKASELADLLADSLEEVSPSVQVKEYLERTIHTMRKTTDISTLQHFFIQAIQGFENRAQDLRFGSEVYDIKKSKKR
jgi:23S rRNA G2445 N2-methylase RlmL